jgi:hypothetical protein
MAPTTSATGEPLWCRRRSEAAGTSAIRTGALVPEPPRLLESPVATGCAPARPTEPLPLAAEPVAAPPEPPEAGGRATAVDEGEAPAFEALAFEALAFEALAFEARAFEPTVIDGVVAGGPVVGGTVAGGTVVGGAVAGGAVADVGLGGGAPQLVPKVANACAGWKSGSALPMPPTVEPKTQASMLPGGGS